MSNPYGDAADLYWAAGWRGILPLPYAAKKNPPAGYTGSTGTDPAYPDVATWADGTDGDRNICLRMPANIVGIDVDAYGDKLGAQTLAAKEVDWGALPPTWRTTSRDDGTSGIRLYRIPEGLAWPGVVGPGIETVRRDHRYAVVWPSIHPEGGTYRWINPHGVVTTNAVPDPETLPMLPDAWVIGLTGGQAAETVDRNNWAEDEAMRWIVALDGATDPQPCTRMARAIDQARKDITSGQSAHDAATAAAARALRLGDEGHRGTVTALTAMRDAFTTEVTRTDRIAAKKTIRTKSEADHEWRDILKSGVNFISANPADLTTCDCDGALTNLITAEPHTTATDDTTETPNPRPAQMRDGASFILDAPDSPPAIWGYGQEVAWAEGESCMIVGPPGVGKTTLSGQVLRARLGLAESVIGYGVTPTTSKVLYLAMDRPQQIARSLRRHFTEADRDVLADRLIVWQGPPPYDLADNPDILLSLCQLADADTVIIDSVKDAAVGLSEDETGAGYNRARQKVLAAGIQVLELHHQTKRGPNGAAPKQLADVYGSAWITAGAGSVILLWGQAGDPVVTLLHLKQPAEDIGPLTLIHDHSTGTTTVDKEEHDLDAYLIANAPNGGLTAAAWAAVIYDEASKNNIEKARTRLNNAVAEGRARVVEGKRGGPPSAYFPADSGAESNHESNHDGVDAGTNQNQSGAITPDDKTAGQSNHDANQANQDVTKSCTHPTLRVGSANADEADDGIGLTAKLQRCNVCGFDAITNPCSSCRNSA